MGARGSSTSGRRKKNAHLSAEFPLNPSQLKHIFRKKHNLEDTPENRTQLLSIGSSENYLGFDKDGNSWFARDIGNGKQMWVSIREGIVQNGGINNFIKRDWPNIIGK
jgi:filamentous hemagglutinin